MAEEVIIFGLGGVGSWLADFLTRINLSRDRGMISKITLVDFDMIEEKNLERQSFKRGDIRGYKCSRVRVTLHNIDNEMVVEEKIMKIQDNTELLEFNENACAFICTDNMASKQMIASYFQNYYIINCDKDFIEIKSYLDESDRNTWSTGDGYTNGQNINSNLKACVEVCNLISLYGITPRRKTRIRLKVESSTRSNLNRG